MNILLFIDSNIKTIPYEVPLLPLEKQGHKLFFLSILSSGPIHAEYRDKGISTFSMGHREVSLKHLPQYVLFLRRFCKAHKIDVVFAHLSIPSLTTLLARPFLKARVVCFRHHYNFLHLLPAGALPVNRIDRLMDRVNAKLAATIVLPSDYLRQLIHRTEAVPLEKMRVIPYVYDWTPFLEAGKNKPVKPQAAPFQLLMISRLTRLKRPALALEVLAQLVNAGIPAKLTIAGVGELEPEMKRQAGLLGVEALVSFVGFQKNVIPLLLQADLLLHPSLTEASSSVIKEAGILGCPVLVCDGVGDFNDYIIHGENGWKVAPADFVKAAVQLVSESTAEERHQLGQNLQQTILQRFSLSKAVVQLYASLLP